MKKILIMSAGLLFLIGCSKEDIVVTDTVQQNLAPENFALISPIAGAEMDVLDITFEWEPAADPDGDIVTYELFLYRENSSPVRIAANLTETSYTLETRSALSANFSWYVLATDGRRETTSPQRNFKTRNLQAESVLSDGSPYSFPHRFSYTAMYFNDAFYIVNGVGEGVLGDVWSSTNYGQRWNLESDLTGSGFDRYGHTSVIHNDRMYVIGGYRNHQPLDDVYASANGSTWLEVAYPQTLGSRYDHSSVVFNDKIWVIGGYNDNIYIDDVMSWTGLVEDRWQLEATAYQTPFNGIRGHSSVVYDNKMWVIGGSDRNGYLDEVWYSEDGINWSSGGHLPRMNAYHKSVVFDDKIWVIGGLTTSGPSNQIYYYDKATGVWANYEMPEGTRALYNHSVVVVDEDRPYDGIYIFGSFDGSEYFNDVWKLY